MAINLSTLKTNCDAVSDQVETESDTDAHYATMITDIKADADSITAVYTLAADCTRIIAALGFGPKFQLTQGLTLDP